MTTQAPSPHRFTAATHPLRVSQLEQLAFRPPEHDEWETIDARLEKLCFRAAIVGPHGSGKTTFLLELANRWRQRGREVVVLFTNTQTGRRVPDSWRESLANCDDDTLVIADGYDVFSWPQRRRLRRVLRPRGGLLVTAHRRAALPTLLQTRTSPQLLAELVNDLYRNHPAVRPSDATLARLYTSCNGNIREVLRRLYQS